MIAWAGGRHADSRGRHIGGGENRCGKCGVGWRLYGDWRACGDAVLSMPPLRVGVSIVFMTAAEGCEPDGVLRHQAKGSRPSRIRRTVGFRDGSASAVMMQAGCAHRHPMPFVACRVAESHLLRTPRTAWPMVPVSCPAVMSPGWPPTIMRPAIPRVRLSRGRGSPRRTLRADVRRVCF